MMNEVYTSELNKCREIVKVHKGTLKTAETNSNESEWISAFTARQNIQELDRRLIVTLICGFMTYTSTTEKPVRKLIAPGLTGLWRIYEVVR